MACWMNSPLAGDTVNGLTVDVRVGYDTTREILTNGGMEQWTVECRVGAQTATPQTVPPSDRGSVAFTFTVPAAGDYQVEAWLKKTTSAGTTTHGNPLEDPIHVAAGGGVVIVRPTPPPPPQPPQPADEEAAPTATATTTTTDPCASCPPVVLAGTFPSAPNDPTTNLVIEVYRVVRGQRVIDYLAVPHILGATLGSAPDGSVRAGTTFSTVLPPQARADGRHYRLYLLGVLGKVILRQSGPVV